VFSLRVFVVFGGIARDGAPDLLQFVEATPVVVDHLHGADEKSVRLQRLQRV